jgi:hypothetical protein
MVKIMAFYSDCKPGDEVTAADWLGEVQRGLATSQNNGAFLFSYKENSIRFKIHSS